MREERNRCLHCGGDLGPKSVDVHFVNPDGCRLWSHDRNVRTRDSIGHGEGSLLDEMAHEVRTPWSSKEHKLRALAHVEGELLEFARSLPYVQVN